MKVYPEMMKSDRQVLRVSELLTAWLDSPSRRVEDVQDWLQGYKLPPVGYDYEPSDWMMRGLAVAEEPERLARELALRLADLLESQPDVLRPGSRPDELLYNLFLLCAELQEREALGRLLLEVFERGQLDGTWRGVSLRYALTVALAHNQLDNTLEPIWRDMVDGHPHEFLKGSRYDAFEALSVMPPNRGSTAPAFDAIGYALKCMAGYLEPKYNRRPEMVSLLCGLDARHRNQPRWNHGLIEQADQHDLPRWTLTCFPSLCFSINQKEKKALVMWEIYYDILKDYARQSEVQHEMCDGRILVVKVGDDVTPFFEMAEGLEKARLETPYRTYSAPIGVIYNLYPTKDRAQTRRNLYRKACST